MSTRKGIRCSGTQAVVHANGMGKSTKKDDAGVCRQALRFIDKDNVGHIAIEHIPLSHYIYHQRPKSRASISPVPGR